MRKVIWCCATVALATACASFWAADYAQRHPKSALGRCLIAASRVAGAHPLLSHNRATAPAACEVSPPATKTTARCPRCQECAEACEAAETGTPCIEKVEEPKQPLVVDKAPFTGEVVVKEEPVIQADLVEEPLPEFVASSGDLSFINEVQCELEACVPAPKYMPPAVVDFGPAPDRMPYLEEDVTWGGHALGTFILRALETKSAVYGGSEEAEVFFSPGKPTDCKIDPAYQDQYPGCPAPGKCPAPAANDKPAKSKTCDECPKPMSFLDRFMEEKRRTDDCPVHRCIDTTEVRPSDLGPNARTGSIPF